MKKNKSLYSLFHKLHRYRNYFLFSVLPGSKAVSLWMLLPPVLCPASDNSLYSHVYKPVHSEVILLKNLP